MNFSVYFSNFVKESKDWNIL